MENAVEEMNIHFDAIIKIYGEAHKNPEKETDTEMYFLQGLKAMMAKNLVNYI